MDAAGDDLIGVERPHDVLVDDGLADLRFAQEPLEEAGRLEEMRMHDLQRDDGADVEPRRATFDARRIDPSHSACAEFAVESVRTERASYHARRSYLPASRGRRAIRCDALLLAPQTQRGIAEERHDRQGDPMSTDASWARLLAYAVVFVAGLGAAFGSEGGIEVLTSDALPAEQRQGMLEIASGGVKYAAWTSTAARFRAATTPRRAGSSRRRRPFPHRRVSGMHLRPAPLRERAQTPGRYGRCAVNRAAYAVASVAVVAAVAAVLLAPGPARGPDAARPKLAPAANPTPTAALVSLVAPFGRGPARFEPNVGQAAADVRWLRRGADCLTLVGDGWFTTVVADGPAGGRRAVSVQFADALAATDARGERRLPARTNYFLGADPTKWIRGVPQYESVLCGAWPGIDVRYHGLDGRLEYDFLVAAGADAGRIVFDVLGADDVTVDDRGDLVLRAGGAVIRHLRPSVFEETGDGPRALPGRYVLVGPNRVRLDVDGRDAARALVIDPSEDVRVGGSAADTCNACAADPAGGFGMCGQTASSDLAGVGPLAGSRHGASDAYVADFDSAGELRWLDIVGCNADDACLDMQFGPEGGCFVCGYCTDAATFPRVNDQQTSGFGAKDGFVLACAPGGQSFDFCYPVGGSADDLCTSVAVQTNASGAATTALFLGVVSKSASLPVAGTPPASFGQAAVLRLSPAGVIAAGRYLGGGASNDDATLGPVRVATSPAGVYAAFSQSGPTHDLFTSSNAFQTTPLSNTTGYVALLGTDLAPARATYVSGTSALTLTSLLPLSNGSVAVGGTAQVGGIATTASTAPQPTAPAGGTFSGFAFVLLGDLSAASEETYVGAGTLSGLTGLVEAPAGDAAPGLGFVGYGGGFAPVGGGNPGHGGFDGFLAVQPLTGGPYTFVTNVGGAGGETIGAPTALGSRTFYAGRPGAVLASGAAIVCGSTSSTPTDFHLALIGPQGSGDGFAAEAEPGVARVPFSRLSVTGGSLRDAEKAASDKLVLGAVFGAAGDGADFGDVKVGGPGALTFDVVALETASTVGSVVHDAVPFASSGWKANATGTRLTFNGATSDGAHAKASVDLGRRTVAITLTGFDTAFDPFGGPALVVFGLGVHQGSTVVQLVRKQPGNFTLAPPLQGVKGGFSFEPTTLAGVGTVTVDMQVLNYDAAPATPTVQLLVRGRPVGSSATPTIPARNPVTLLPGQGTVPLEVYLDKVGVQTFVEEIDDAKAATAKFKVSKPPAGGVPYVGPLIGANLEDSGGALADWFLDGTVSNPTATPVDVTFNIQVDGKDFGAGPETDVVPAKNGAVNGFFFFGRDGPLTAGAHVAKFLIDGKVAKTFSFTAK
jgi:hypothetical protein